MSKNRIGRDVAIVLVLKTAALLILYWLFFGPSHRIHVDARALFGAPPPIVTRS